MQIGEPTDYDQSSPLGRASRWLAHLEDALNLLAAFAIFFLMFVGVTQVLGRSIFNIAIYGYIDYIEQATPLFAALGISYCQRVGGHIRMDLVLRGLPKRTMWLFEATAIVVALVIITLLIESSFTNFLRAYRLGDSTMDIKLPVWPSKLVYPVSFCILWLRLVIQLIGYGRLVAHPDAAPVAVPVIASVEELVQAEIEEALGPKAKEI